MTDVWSCMWQFFDGYHCLEFLFLCINLDLFVPNKLCTTSREFFWPWSGNSLCSYYYVLSEPHLRTGLWAEFVAGVSAIDKTAWVVKMLLYSFLMVQVTLSCRIFHSSVSGTAVRKFCICFYIGIAALHQDTIFFTKLWLPLFFIHSWEGISLLQNSVCSEMCFDM